MSRDMTFWLVARASGMAAYTLLTASVLAGLVVKSRPVGRAVRASAATDLHRTLALLGLGYLALHGAALLLDRTVQIAPVTLVVPGLSPYRPLAVGLGVVAGELMLLVYASFRLRRRLGIRGWRMLHRLSFFVFAGATAHGIAAGTDTGRPWAIGLYLGAVGAVGFATAWRLLAAAPSSRATATRSERA